LDICDVQDLSGSAARQSGTSSEILIQYAILKRSKAKQKTRLNKKYAFNSKELNPFLKTDNHIFLSSNYERCKFIIVMKTARQWAYFF
jgi:hypothetical protein